MSDPTQIALAKLRELLDEPTAQMKAALPNKVSGTFPGPDGDITLSTPRPPQFQPAPKVIGGPPVQRAMDNLLKIAPNLQGMIDKVQVGPTNDVMGVLDLNNKLYKTKFRPEDLRGLDLLGLTNIKTGNISLNQRGYEEDPQWDMGATLAHEAGHIAGYNDENRPEEARRLYSELRDLKYIKD